MKNKSMEVVERTFNEDGLNYFEAEGGMSFFFGLTGRMVGTCAMLWFKKCPLMGSLISSPSSLPPRSSFRRESVLRFWN